MRCVAALLLLSLAGCDSSSPSLSASSAANTPSGVADVTRDCFWAVRSDADLVNVLYPDRYATYWGAELAIPPGGEVLLRGRYPQARYMSFNLYNPRLEPLDALADVEIAPLTGANPFALGADRQTQPRDYEVRIVAGVRPADVAQREPNTLYSFQTLGPQTVPSPLAVVLYRIYVEDEGQDISGGAGLPQVVLRLNGQELTGSEACTALEPQPSANTGALINTLDPPVETQPNTAAFTHLQWLKFFDLQAAQANRFNATPLGETVSGLLGQSEANAGGFASNVHNNYIYATLSQSLGTVGVIAARAPSAPATRAGEARMGEGDLRYFSFCTNDANSQRYFDCAYDEQLVRDTRGRFVLAVSREADRPANATAGCGVTWLNWGPLSQSLLIYRHMLPQPAARFPQAIQYIAGPAGANEESSMGDYFPYGMHLDRAAFEALGCPVDAGAVPHLNGVS